MASEKANELAGTLTTCPMVSHLSTLFMCEEFAPVIDAAVAPLLNELARLSAWLDRLASRAELSAKDTRFGTMREAWEADAKNYRATGKNAKALLRAWGRK